MRISHTHKFIFIAIPKTASTVIRNVLTKHSDIAGNGDNKSLLYRHTTPTALKTYFESKGWDWEVYFKFTFVRNPFARIVSQYFYWLKCAKNDPSQHSPEYYRNCKLVAQKTSNFSDFIKMKDFSGMHEYSQVRWATEAVGFIGKLENLQQDFNTICDKIGIPKQKLPHENKTNHKHYTEYYDDETRQIVAEKYAKDIETFGYEFGE